MELLVCYGFVLFSFVVVVVLTPASTYVLDC